MAKLGTFTLKGKTGETYAFDTYPLKQPFKPLGSLYCITSRSTNGNHKVLYIGQTGDLSERFDDHHKEEMWIRNGATNISIHLDSAKLSRLSKETDMVAYYNPCCNG